MASKQRDLLEVLELELEFLKSGGYRKLSSWRPQFIFEDSPTCLHFWKSAGQATLFRMCPDAVGASGISSGSVPCRHIPLNEKNETIQSLYQYGTAEELEAALGEWLMNMIQKLELERTLNRDGLAPKRAKERIENFWSQATMFFTCSNPDCAEPFRLSPGTTVSISQRSAGHTIAGETRAPV